MAIVARGDEGFDHQRAASKAERLLGWIDKRFEEREATELLFETPDELAPRGMWLYGIGYPSEGSTWEDVDLVDTQRMRDNWREHVEGPPPWKRARVPTVAAPECRSLPEEGGPL